MERFLSKQEEETLQEAHRASREKRQADRIKTVLLLNWEYSFAEITKILMLDNSTLRKYYREYEEGGLDELLTDHYVGTSSRLGEQQEAELKKHLDTKLYTKAEEVVEYVKDRYGVEYTVNGMTQLLHRQGFVYKKPKRIPGKFDAEKQQEFVKKYKGLKANMKEEDVNYFTDATHPQHNSQPAYGWILKGKTKELKSNTGRKRVNLHGALDIETLGVVIREDKTIDYESTLGLFGQLEKKHPTGTIWIIVDNATYYKSKEVKEYLEDSRIKIEFLPPYSPNLNIIERLWKLMHEEILNNKYYSSYLEFKEACLGFFDNIQDYREKMELRLTDNFEVIPTWN